jgi:hypothetical protein
MSMSVKERAAYAAWKRACATAAQEGEPRECACGTLLGLAALVVLLIGLMGLGGAKAARNPDRLEPGTVVCDRRDDAFRLVQAEDQFTGDVRLTA